MAISLQVNNIFSKNLNHMSHSNAITFIKESINIRSRQCDKILNSNVIGVKTGTEDRKDTIN